MNYIRQVVNGIKDNVKNELKDELITKDVFYAEIKSLKSELLLEIEKLKSENKSLKQLIYFLIIINILAMTIFSKEFIEFIKLLFKIGG